MIKQKHNVVQEMYEGRVRGASQMDPVRQPEPDRLIQTAGGSVIDRVTGKVIVAGSDMNSQAVNSPRAQYSSEDEFVQAPVARQAPPASTAMTTGKDNLPVSQIVAEFQDIGSRLGTMTIRELRGPDVRSRIDHFHNAGRQDIANASKVVSSLGTRNFVGETNSEAFKSMQELSTIFGDIQQADKSTTQKLFGWLPFVGNSVISYLEKFKSSTEMIDSLIGKLDATQTTLEEHDRELTSVSAQLADNRFKLEDVSTQMSQMIAVIDHALAAVEDPERKAFIEAEMLFPLKRNLQSVNNEQAMVVQAMLNIEQQRSMARSLHHGVDEMKTHGMSALSLAVMLARTQGFQISTATALTNARGAINQLMSANASMSEQTAKVMIEYESKPLTDVQVVKDAVTIMLNTIKTTQNARIANSKKIDENIAQIKTLLGDSSIQMRLEASAEETKLLAR